ncbi:unnamed protein product [Closterium sp. NIES-53]
MARGTVSGRAAEVLRNALGGVRGRQNAAAWLVAGTAAYFLWVRPEWEKQREREVRRERRGGGGKASGCGKLDVTWMGILLVRREAMRRWRESGEAERYAEKVAPRADPQVGGLIIGDASKNRN